VATCVTLASFTEEKVEDVADLPDRIDRVEELKRSTGGEPVGFFVTSGQNDPVAASEMPDAEATAKVQLASAMARRAPSRRRRSGRSTWTRSGRCSRTSRSDRAGTSHSRVRRATVPVTSPARPQVRDEQGGHREPASGPRSRDLQVVVLLRLETQEFADPARDDVDPWHCLPRETDGVEPRRSR
jgi:uncharacterized protein with GYD domain